MKKPFALLLAAILLAFCPSHAHAWSAPGHMIIAAEAYRQLSPDLQKRATEILQSHPDYAKWQATYPKYGDGMDLPTYMFMRAAVWPDEINRDDNPNNQYAHPHWHYVDYPLKPPTFPLEPAPAPNDDVLYGVAQCEKILSDTNTTPVLKAVYLSYLIHLIGDLHQPLHCCSFVDATYPNGDRGGNDVWIKPADRAIKLHSFWDQLLGSRPNERLQLNDAIRIPTEHPASTLPELAKDTTPKSWTLESRQLALDHAYLRGQLKGGTTQENAPPLPEGYTKAAKLIAEKQAALAGYRLEKEIQQYLK